MTTCCSKSTNKNEKKERLVLLLQRALAFISALVAFYVVVVKFTFENVLSSNVIEFVCVPLDLVWMFTARPFK